MASRENRGGSNLSACVINHEGEAVLEGTLRALFEEGTAFDEVVLVDDASKDRSLAIVRERFPSVRIVALEENRGPAHARQTGFLEARGDRVLFLDNDVSPLPGSVALLTEALDEIPRAVLAVPRVLFASKPDTIQYDGARSHFTGVQVPENEGLPKAGAPAGIRRIDSMISACFLLDRARWGTGPLFDPSFFIYLEDHDLGFRARLAGHEVLAVPRAECLHGEGTAGLSLRRSGRYTPRRVRCLIRNRWQVVLRLYSARTLLLLSPALLLYEIAQIAIALRMGWIGLYLGSVGWLLGRSGALCRERRRIQEGRKTPDREILSGGPLPLREEMTEGAAERAGRRMLEGALDFYWRWVVRVL